MHFSGAVGVLLLGTQLRVERALTGPTKEDCERACEQDIRCVAFNVIPDEGCAFFSHISHANVAAPTKHSNAYIKHPGDMNKVRSSLNHVYKQLKRSVISGSIGWTFPNKGSAEDCGRECSRRDCAAFELIDGTCRVFSEVNSIIDNTDTNIESFVRFDGVGTATLPSAAAFPPPRESFHAFAAPAAQIPTTSVTTTTTSSTTTTTTTTTTLTTTSPTPTLTTILSLPCEVGWTYFAHTRACYKELPYEYINWEELESRCVSLKAHLMSIHSLVEISFLEAWSSKPQVAVGFKASGLKLGSWTDGSPVNFELSWSPGLYASAGMPCTYYYKTEKVFYGMICSGGFIGVAICQKPTISRTRT